MQHIPAYRGEFGLKVFYHAPQVATICEMEPTKVYIEPGDEALYPYAAEFGRVGRQNIDSLRVAPPPNYGVKPTRFVPEPVIRRGITTDIVVCPRFRLYGKNKNWPHWGELVARLGLEGHDVFAAGAPDSSHTDFGSIHGAWEYTRFLDASIEAIRSAKLVIATDAGLAHLAVLCGAPLLLITYRGLVAPGPVFDSQGRRVRESYWKAGHAPHGDVCRFEEANHTGSAIGKLDAWDDPTKVAAEATRIVRG